MAVTTRLLVARTPEERQRAYRLRYAVYVDEMGKSQVPGTRHPEREIRDDHDDRAEVLCLEDGDEVIGTVRNIYAADYLPVEYRQWFGLEAFDDIPREQISFTSRLMLADAHRGTSAIAALLKETYVAGRARGVIYTFIHCTPALIPLYEMLGFRVYRRGLANTDVGQHVPMLLVADDLGHLELTRSPFRKYAVDFSVRPPSDDWFARRFPHYQLPSSRKVAGEDAFFASLSSNLTNERGAILEGISAEALDGLTRGGAIIDVADGDYVLRAEEGGRDLFVVLAGLVEVVLGTASGSRRVLCTIGPGQVLGEVSFLYPTLRTADAISVGNARLLCLTQEAVQRAISAAPESAARFLLNLSKVLATRLAMTTKMLREDGSPA